MNAVPTAETAEQIAARLEDAAKEIRHQALKMREDGDLTRASEVANAVTNCFGSLRLDLLVTRPLREHERANVLRERQSEM